MNCPSCGKENRLGSAFCQYCGQRLAAEPAIQTPPLGLGDSAPKPARYEPPTATAAGAAAGAAAAQWPERVAGRAPAELQMGAGGSQAMDIWGPFAGYGNRGHHASWLLDDLAGKADELHRAVTERLGQREIPNAQMNWRQLTGKGVFVERRPFFLIQRGITTVALYIGRFGRDLFISQVTYAKGPISAFRVIILVLMLLFQLYYSTAYASSLLNALTESLGSFSPLFGASSSPDMGPFLFMLCFVGPLGFINTILLYLAAVYSLYKWLKEKDILAILRTPPNEFQLDDIVALEKSVEESVRQSLDKVGIDAALMPPKLEQATPYRRRLI
jgi:hypothetical protein